MDPICPVCHVTVRPSDFYCYNCGKNLHEKPAVITPVTEILYYIGSLILPPIGLWWGYKLFRQNDARNRRIGIVCVAITVISTIVVTYWTMNIFQTVNSQVNQQLQGIQGL